MDADQGVTLMEIYRMVGSIKADVAKIAEQGAELGNTIAGHKVMLDRHDHDIRGLKQTRVNKQFIAANMPEQISVKSLIAIIAAISSAVTGLVTAAVAYFKS